jgi:hypothetical protein
MLKDFGFMIRRARGVEISGEMLVLLAARG